MLCIGVPQGSQVTRLNGLADYIRRASIPSNLLEARKARLERILDLLVRSDVSPIVSVALLTFGRIPTRQGQSREYMSRGDMTPLDSARTSRNERLTEKGTAIVKASKRISCRWPYIACNKKG
jgi:hypothetical protein